MVPLRGHGFDSQEMHKHWVLLWMNKCKCIFCNKCKCINKCEFIFNKCKYMFYLQTNVFAQLCCRFTDIWSAALLTLWFEADWALVLRDAYMLIVIAHYWMSCNGGGREKRDPTVLSPGGRVSKRLDLRTAPRILFSHHAFPKAVNTIIHNWCCISVFISVWFGVKPSIITNVNNH